MSFDTKYFKYLPQLGEALWVHITYVFWSVLMGTVIALVLAIFLSRNRKLAKFVLPLMSVFQTIPGIVFIGILFILIGMKPITIILALGIYAIMPILKNAYTGIISVDAGLLEAGKGCGMNSLELLTKIELPMAISAIFGGIRMSTIYIISWAVMAAMIGQGGLGEFIYRGIDTNVKEYIIMGAVPAALLAIVSGLLIDKLQFLMTPKGLRAKP
jgi:osmoprotectant transport system permease protein